MSQRIKTPITGITTTSVYDEGSCYSLVNLRPKNGALHPVSPRKVVQELSRNYDLVFVHQNNNYKNWIGVKHEGNNSSIYWDILVDNPKTIKSYISGKIHSVQQIGNTLSFITTMNVYYAWFTNNDYVYLDELPQVPVIQWGVKSKSTLKSYYVNEYGANTVTPDMFIDATKGLVNKGIQALIDEYGMQLFDAHIARYAFRLYDGTLTKHSPPILLMPGDNILEMKRVRYLFYDTIDNDSYIEVKGYKAAMTYDFTMDGDYIKWKDIITSIDIFLSAPLGISNIENMRKDLPTDERAWIEKNLIKEISPDNLKQINNTSIFYFIRSIPLGSQSEFLEPDEFPSIESDVTKIENLIYQEVMSDDNFTNHKYGASVSYAYNNRLHLAGIKTTFFNGFNLSYFNYRTKYNGVEIVSGDVNALVAEVEIEAGTILQKVYSFYNVYIYAPKLFASAFISYPDIRAKRITFYEISGSIWTKVFSVPLEKHNLLNLAYFINEGMKPITGNNLGVFDSPNTSQSITLLEPNKIKVSDLSNPLRFPNENTYVVGNGTILAMATNTMNVSDRNYGQYPLYVFTTQGIWTLNVSSGEVVYSTLSAPTYSEAPTTPIVCSTPIGVVFTTQRGLQIINGQSVNFISPQLDQDYLDINMELPEAQCKDVIYLFNDKSFKEYLRGIERMIYNPYESELIIFDKDSEYNYVLHLPSQSFYKSTEHIDIAVDNVFPELLVIGNNKLKDFATTNNPETHVCIVLRPIIFGTLDIKNLERIVLRSLLVNIQNITEGKKSVIMVHYSNDGINFPALRGLTSEPCNRRDYDMGLFASSKFRQFIFSFAGIVDESSKIHFLDTQIKQEYNNTKMR